jgi:Recombination endonuclease VII
VKQCSKCKIVKELVEFNKDYKGTFKRQAYCRDCQKLVMGGGEYKLQRNFNMSLADKKKMVEQQNDACGICKKAFKGKTKAQHVDHCHTTLKVRGILCPQCNTTLGLVKESVTTLYNMIDYVEHHAKENTTAPVPTRVDSESNNDPQLGTIPTTRVGQNGHDTDNHSGAVQRQNVNHRAKASSADSMGHRDKQMATSQQLDLLEGIGE